jgi:hypothetical protein
VNDARTFGPRVARTSPVQRVDAGAKAGADNKHSRRFGTAKKDLSRGGELARIHRGADRPRDGSGPAEADGPDTVGGGAPVAPARPVSGAPGSGPIAAMEGT